MWDESEVLNVQSRFQHSRRHLNATRDRALAQHRERERERGERDIRETRGLGPRESEGRKEREKLNRWSGNTQKTMSSGGERRRDL